ncbi:MAG: diguanylate cyclase [Candidatus Dormibacteraeota bacterium]|nr:diguanylate cyclase [Candidatus Dormibacteraeota bacterium]
MRTRRSFSAKFAFIIAVTGVLVAVVPLALAGRANSLQASERAADKAGVVVNLIVGQQQSLSAFASGMAQELGPSLIAADHAAIADTLTGYSQVNSATDVVGVTGPLAHAAASNAQELPGSDPLLASLTSGVRSGLQIVPGPSGAPWVIGTAAVGTTGEHVFIARPIDAPFMAQLDSTITTAVDAAGVAIVRDDHIVAAGSTLAGMPVAAGTVLSGDLKTAVAHPSTAQDVNVGGHQAGTSVLALGSGYVAVVTTPVSTVSALWQSLVILLGLIVVAMTCMVLVVQTQLQRPLRRLDRAVAALARQQYDVPVDAGGRDEIGRLAATFENMRRELRATIVGSRARAAIATSVNSPQQLETALQQVCAQLRTTTDADIALILVNQSEIADSFSIADGIAANKHLRTLLDADGPLGAVYSQDSSDPTMVCALPPTDEHRIGAREICAVPLCIGRSVMGVLAVARYDRGFGAAAASLVGSASEQVALALERHRYVAMVQRQATVDDLTGLYNHRFLVDYLGQQVAVAERLHTSLAILVIDLDHFKQVNDTWGHPAGDIVLRAFAECLTGNIRRADLAARYGGEEFVVVMSDTAAADARIVADKIRAAAEALMVPVDPTGAIELTVSIGGAAFPEDTGSARELLATADAALYDAKRAGRNRVSMSGSGDGDSEAAHNVTTVRRRRSAQ